MTAVQFTVLGVAAPQGSKTRTKWGSMREDNPRTMPWRQEVAAVAKKAMGGMDLLLGPVRLTVECLFPRPKSHYRTGKRAADLKANAPGWVHTKPDLSKLVRAIEDAMTGIVFRDDSQVCETHSRKTYSTVEPYALITVEQIQEQHGQEAIK